MYDKIKFNIIDTANNILQNGLRHLSGKSNQSSRRIGKLQCHLLDISNRTTQSKFTQLETVKLC